MEHADWMNAEVRQEIEDLQRTHGLEEEAAAFWHLARAPTDGPAAHRR